VAEAVERRIAAQRGVPAGGVIQELPDRDLGEARVDGLAGRGLEPPQEGERRRVQLQPAVLDEPEDADGGHHLRHTPDPEEGVGFHGLLRLDVREAVSPREDDTAHQRTPRQPRPFLQDLCPALARQSRREH
jgi:hypothetical protein